MIKNNKTHYVKFIVLCAVILFTSSFILKNITFDRIKNSALVLGVPLSQKDYISQINAYTSQAESASRKINSIWTTGATKKKERMNLSTILLQRKDLMIAALEKSDSLDTLTILSSNVDKNVASDNLIEKRVTVTGQISTLHVDDFENKKATNKYSINSDREKMTYSFVPNHDVIGELSGRASISGIAFGSQLYASIDTTKIVKDDIKNEEPVLEGQNIRNTLVILINFLDSTEVPFTKNEAEGIIFDGQFDKFMKEQSYNKADFEGDAFGWLTLEANSTQSCDLDGHQAAIDAFAVANDIKINNYEHLVYILNCQDPGFPYSSVGAYNFYLGGISGKVSKSVLKVSLSSALKQYNDLPFSWTYLDFILAHELGHGLGLPHANGIDCDTRQIEAPCAHIEYGNTFDVMGTLNVNASHNNGPYKKKLGWINSDNIISVTESGIFQLSPLESSDKFNSKKIALISPLGQEEPIYSVEYRASIGFDAHLGQKQGLYINKINSETSQLIDTQPTSLNWHQDISASKLTLEQPFVDNGSGITIKLINNPNLTAKIPTFEVTLVPVVCVNNPPAISVGNIYLAQLFGGQNWHAVPISNTDSNPCPPSNFFVEILPNQILESSVPYNPNGVLPGAGFTAYFFIKALPGTPAGVYPIEVKATNVTSGLFSIETFNFTVQ